MIRLKQTGDTIVEVLIAIAVLTSAMSGAFVSARRSSNATRQSQERIEGLKAAEEQVERLKVLASNPADPGQLFVGTAGNQFCIDKVGNRQNLTGVLPPLAAADTFTVYYVSGGGPAASDSCPRPAGGVTYYPAVIRNLATNTFVVYVRWERVGGGGNEEATLAYRIYND